MQTLSQEELDMAPCMTNGIAYGEAARNLAEVAKSLGNDRWAILVKAWCVPFLFHGIETIFKSDNDPIPQYIDLLNSLNSYLQSISESKLKDFFSIAQHSNDVKRDYNIQVEEITGNHYGKLFSGFSDDSYFNEAKYLLKTRLERNGIDIENLGDKTLLDMGCGGGRYTVAWKLLGVKEAVGLDISEIGLENARQRVAKAGIEGVRYVQGSVLKAPIEDNSFDIVYSNGVFHHTTDWKKGIAEQVRILKPGGMGWQYLIENPGGIFWDNIEILRVILKNVNHDYAREALADLGIPPNRIFYMLDHSMVPINIRLTPEEVEEEYRKNGAKDIVRLKRGTDFDHVEAIHRNDPYDRIKFGVGENRYIFTK